MPSPMKVSHPWAATDRPESDRREEGGKLETATSSGQSCSTEGSLTGSPVSGLIPSGYWSGPRAAGEDSARVSVGADCSGGTCSEEASAGWSSFSDSASCGLTAAALCSGLSGSTLESGPAAPPPPRAPAPRPPAPEEPLPWNQRRLAVRRRQGVSEHLGELAGAGRAMAGKVVVEVAIHVHAIVQEAADSLGPPLLD